MTATPMIAQALTTCGIAVFPCHENKAPAIKDGFKAASVTPGDYWPSTIVGVPVIAGTFIIDVDSYKGMTTAKIEKVLGCQLDWGAAYLQNTPSGGAHYAFKIDNQSLQQGSDLYEDLIGEGFDTRAFNRGYIGTGESYLSTDIVGVLKLAHPQGLPELPPEALKLLEVPPEAANQEPKIARAVADEEVERMLSHISADCSRSDWLKVGLALKHQYADQDVLGFEIFNSWSASAPDAYDQKEAAKLWNTVKAQGEGTATTTLGTLVHKAITGGYIPESIAANVFGLSVPGEQWAEKEPLDALIDELHKAGGDVKYIEYFSTKISTFPCSSLQRKGIINIWHRAFSDQGLKFSVKELNQWAMPRPVVVQQTTEAPVTFTHLSIKPIKAVSNVHMNNAKILSDSVFGTRLCSFNGDQVHWWNGRNWERVKKHDMLRQVAESFGESEHGKMSNIQGTEQALRLKIPHRETLAPTSRKIFFNNGVLDMDYGVALLPHHQENLNPYCLSVNYDPVAQCPEWHKFVNSIFEGEENRGLLLQEILGWCLINDSLGHQKAIAFDGVPRSGKGTILEILKMILGESASDLALEQIVDPKAISAARGCNVIFDRDSKKPERNKASAVHGMFNKITANEPVTIPILYSQDPWEGKLNTKFIAACNGIPVMTDDSGAAPNRWVILKFTKSFLGREDVTLINKLTFELPGIVVWAVEGLRRLIAHGKFTLPESSIEQSSELIEISSPYTLFVEERMKVGLNERAHNSDLWASFRAWCTDSNNRLPSRQNFIRSLRSTLAAQGVEGKQSVRIGHKVSPGLIGAGLADGAVIPGNVASIFKNKEPV